MIPPSRFVQATGWCRKKSPSVPEILSGFFKKGWWNQVLLPGPEGIEFASFLPAEQDDG